MQTQTNNQTSKNTQHISNWSNFNEQYNDLGLNIHLETYSYKQELIKIAQRNYQEQDIKKLLERIQDLETTLQINKGLVHDSMSALAVVQRKIDSSGAALAEEQAAKGQEEATTKKDAAANAESEGGSKGAE